MPTDSLEPAAKIESAKRVSGNIADRNTPLIKNCWYILDWSAEVKNEFKNRMVLSQDVVYFRTKGGEVAVLQNRCAHRGFPLYRSTLLDNDTIQCGYHGLTYNVDGRCIKVPSSANQNPSSISIHRYPVAERSPMIWIWPGDPGKADPALIPDVEWVTGKEWGYGTGYYHLDGNYLAIHENLMDITHFFFLHGAAVGTSSHTESAIEVTVKGNTVDNYRITRGDPVPEFHRKATGLPADAPIIRHGHSTFVSPGFHDALGKFEDPAGTNNGRTDYHPHILHFMTPETQYTTHYWWIFARDFQPNSKKLDNYYSDTTEAIFLEDKDAIEWMEQQWAKEDRPEFIECHVPSDEGAVRMRRIIQRMADEERAAK